MGSFAILPSQVVNADPAGVTVQRYYANLENEWTTTTTSFVDIQPSAGFYPLKLTFTPPSTANYLLIFSSSLSNSNTNYATNVQLLQNTTQIFVQSYIPASVTDYVIIGFTEIVSLTGGTSYTFNVQFSTGNASGTAKIRDTHLMLFKVDNYYQSNNSTPATYNTGTYTDGLSLSIPSSATGDYLVLASTSVVSSMSSKYVFCNWLRGAASQTEIQRTLNRASESRGWLLMRVMTFTEVAETIKFQFKIQTPNSLTVNNQNLIAVKLSDLGIDTQSLESEGATSTTATAYSAKATKTFTPSPAKQGDYAVFAFAMLNGNSTKSGNEVYTRLNIDSSYSVEKVFLPNDVTDYIPFFAFKKYRTTGSSHTINIEYKTANTSTTASLKNARILAIKVNTLQSYQDAAVTTRTTFDGTYNTIHIYGYGYQYKWETTPATGMPYNVAYYDGGAAHDGVNGAKVYTHTINSNLDRSIYSTLDFYNVPAASYGTWHAVVYRADTGDPAPPATYAANNSNSYMEITFTVQQSALYTPLPVLNSVALYNADRLTATTAITPQTEYAVRVNVTNANTLANLSTVKVTIFFDSDGIYAAVDVPLTGNTQTAAILTCTVGATPPWTIDPGASTTWSIVSANCLQPTITDTTGDFWFHFKAGKVATATTGAAKWHIYAKATNAGGFADNYQANHTMNWYGEVVVNTPSVNFGTVTLGSDFTDNQQTSISVTYISNGNYNQQIKASSPWEGSGYMAYLNATGNPGESEFSIKADDTATYSSAFLVSTNYIAIDTGTQTSESGNTESANTLWLKLGALGMPALTYNGTIYYAITQ